MDRPQARQARARRHDVMRRYPNLVDLIPSADGFKDDAETQIIVWLSTRQGTFELFGEMQGEDVCVRYCFAKADDARAFYRAFAPAAERAALHIRS